MKRRMRVRIENKVMKAWRMVPRRVCPVPWSVRRPERTHWDCGVSVFAGSFEGDVEVVERKEHAGGSIVWFCELVLEFEFELGLELMLVSVIGRGEVFSKVAMEEVWSTVANTISIAFLAKLSLFQLNPCNKPNTNSVLDALIQVSRSNGSSIQSISTGVCSKGVVDIADDEGDRTLLIFQET